MICFIAYDIKDNRIRARLIRQFQNLGFTRVQKSLFLGDVSAKNYITLQFFIGKTIDFENDSIYIFPQCIEDFHNTVFLSKNDSHKRITSEFLII
ncbi:MAG: CRISPR-associated endonuclease Cas2 [Fusobacteriaceae bacterium]